MYNVLQEIDINPYIAGERFTMSVQCILFSIIIPHPHYNIILLTRLIISGA